MSFFVITIEFTFAIGSVSYGVIDLALPEGSSLLAQKLWASIGWSTGLLNVFDDVGIYTKNLPFVTRRYTWCYFGSSRTRR